MGKSQKPDTKKTKNGKKIIMKPIEEDQDKNHVSKLAYKCIFQRCHDDLKFMQIGEKSEDDFFKSPAQLQNAHMVIKNVKN